MQAVHSPRMSQEFYDELIKTFKQLTIKPGTSMQEIQYNAGQQNVINYIQYKLTGKYGVHYVQDESKPSLFERARLFIRRVYDKIRNV